MIHTVESLKAWLADDANWMHKHKAWKTTNGIEFAGVRKPITIANRVKLSIQQSSFHHCDINSVELEFVPELPIIAEYGEDGIYNYVPIETVVMYLNELEFYYRSNS